MRHSHAPAEFLAQIRRIDRQFGGAWSKLDIDDRAKDWAQHLAVVPLKAVEAAVDWLIEHHEGNYPKLAHIRRLALEHAARHAPADTGNLDDRCPTCGEPPGWHRIARVAATAEIARRQALGQTVDLIAEPTLAPVVERLVYRHRIGYPCQRFNAAYHFADGDQAEAA